MEEVNTQLNCNPRAMGGSMDFKSALSLRLDVMKPSESTIRDFLAAHPHRVSKGTA